MAGGVSVSEFSGKSFSPLASRVGFLFQGAKNFDADNYGAKLNLQCAAGNCVEDSRTLAWDDLEFSGKSRFLVASLLGMTCSEGASFEGDNQSRGQER